MLSLETIVAPVTPPGEGGVGIVRLSGPDAIDLLRKAFISRADTDSMESHRMYHGHLLNREGKRVDEVLAVVMRSPHSYTGEDVSEVHCHGGTLVMRSVLDVFLDAGAIMAAPGEFTQRAFLNGRLDLAQAEAVMALIHARSGRAGQIALNQLDGHLSNQIHDFSKQLIESLTLLEAHIDFPDDEVGELNLSMLMKPIQSVTKEMQVLADTFEVGRVIQEGVSILILGRPNVGKSSLMNALLGEERSIVTEVAGTTRDTLEELLIISGFPVKLIDAAGVRDTKDPVEREGVRRAQEKVQSADLVLLVVDGSTPLSDEDRLAYELCEANKTLLIINKCDKELLSDYRCLGYAGPVVEVSAKHCLGLHGLRGAIAEVLGSGALLTAGEGVVVTERRHRDALLQALKALNELQLSIGSCAPLECLAMDLRAALNALGQITGETTPDQILDEIFSRFCIGK